MSATTPAAGGVAGGTQTTVTSYDLLMRAVGMVYADSTSVTNIYYPTGQLESTYGSRTYPVGYGYDYAGRMKTMTNWSDFGSGTETGARVTTWTYDADRGFLTGKMDAVGQSVSHGYTAAGRLQSRNWARGTNTTYAYNTAGDLYTVSYSDSTPGMTILYDPLGRRSTVTRGGTTTTFTYDLVNDLLSESYSGGILNGLKVTNQFDAELRRTDEALENGSTMLSQAIYGYDGASRLASVSDGVNAAGYSYVANSSLVQQIVFTHSGTTEMTTSKQYDYLNRLSSIASGSNSFSYSYNTANQRTLNRTFDGSYWRYGYDELGQVTSGKKYWSDQTPVAGQQFDYDFDTIGNRLQTEAGGDQNGANLRVANYTNNILNQITSRDVPSAVDIMGDTLATNTVSVNGTAAYAKGEYFREQLAVNNTTSAQWESVMVTAPGQGSVAGHVLIPRTPETNAYDADGNLIQDGRWVYTWDAENRLINMTSLATAPSGSQLMLNFAYDYQGRRIQKIVFTNNGSYLPEYTNNYVYDGWNCIAVLNPNLSLLDSFMWGSDLSGSSQGAGGVGGLMEVTYYGSSTTNCFVAYDGNGNVSDLVDGNAGITLANYDYGPFGEVIRATGPMAKLNPFRFSTEYDDDESDMVYYGYRYYNPSTGRWLNRDPIGERGGINLYGYVGNNPINYFDPFGLDGAAALGALEEGGVYAGEEEAVGLGPEDPAADIAAAGTLLAALGVAAWDYFQPAVPTASQSTSLPWTGTPGSIATSDTHDGKPKQAREYGPDGYPKTDTDYDHDHGQGKPHCHDVGRPSDGSPPTHNDRAPGRPPTPSDPTHPNG